MGNRFRVHPRLGGRPELQLLRVFYEYSFKTLEVSKLRWDDITGEFIDQVIEDVNELWD